MAGGKWTMVDTKDASQRSGFYLNFVSDAVAGIAAGAAGVVAIPVTAPWGPEATIVSIENERQLEASFSKKDVGTAYKQIKDALKNARKVLAYRMAVGGLKASATLADAAAGAANAATLTALFTGSFGNDLSFTVADSLAEVGKKEFKVHNGSELLERFTFDGTVDGLMTVVNGNSQFVTVAKVIAATLANASGVAMAGGNDGTTGLTSNQYTNALNAFEGKAFEWNTLAFVTKDATFALQTTAADFIKRLRSEGFYVSAVMGHFANKTATDATEFTNAKAKAQALDHEGLIYHFIGGVVKDAKDVVTATYTPADMNGLIAGIIAGAGAERSTTYAAVEGVELANVLTNAQVREANKVGLMVAFNDGVANRIEKGINTLTTYGADKHAGYSKIKVIATLDAVGNALTQSANKNYVGKVLNDGQGQDALVGAIKDAFDVFVQGRMVKPGYVVVKDAATPSLGDQFFVSMALTPIDSMDEVYGTIRVGR